VLRLLPDPVPLLLPRGFRREDEDPLERLEAERAPGRRRGEGRVPRRARFDVGRTVDPVGAARIPSFGFPRPVRRTTGVAERASFICSFPRSAECR
jgi:hypothetical protein